MKKPEPRAEYDFRGGVRGRHAQRAKAGDNIRVLDPDLAVLFPDSAAVNEALRGLLPPKGTNARAAEDG